MNNKINNIILTLFLIIFFNINSYNQNHLKQLLETNNCPNCDLSGADLTGLKFPGGNFFNANLTDAKFSGAKLDHCDFRKAKLIGTIEPLFMNQTILNNAKFQGATLKNVNLVNSPLQNADFSDATLIDVNFTYSPLENAKFIGSKFNNTNFDRTDLYLANFLNSRGKILTILNENQGCPSGALCPSIGVNFCCTTMPDGSTKTDKLSPNCTFARRQVCSID